MVRKQKRGEKLEAKIIDINLRRCRYIVCTSAHTPRAPAHTLHVHQRTHSTCTSAHTPRAPVHTLHAHQCTHSTRTSAHTPRAVVLHSALKENPEVDHINEKFYSWMKIHTLLEKFCRISLYVTDDAIAIDVKFSQTEGNC